VDETAQNRKLLYNVCCYDCQVSTIEGGHTVGKVYKQWAGLAREMFSDADHFGVNCEFAFNV